MTGTHRRLFTQQLLRVFRHRMVIAQVVHVRIEAGAANDKGTKADNDNQKDSCYQWFLAVEGIIDDTADEGGESTSRTFLIPAGVAILCL